MLENNLKEIEDKLDFLIENLTERKEVFNSKEAAEFLCISYDYLLELSRNGDIRHKKNGQKYIYKRSWLDEWLEN